MDSISPTSVAPVQPPQVHGDHPFGGPPQADVSPGMKLNIPTAGGGHITHNVAPGETVDSIAQRYHANAFEIRGANPDQLSSGQPPTIAPTQSVSATLPAALAGPVDKAQPWAGTQLTIPASNSRLASTHTVLPGETIDSIAKSNGVDPNALRQANATSLELQNPPKGESQPDVRFSSMRYHGVRGPAYQGTTPLKDYAGWNQMIKDGTVSQADKTIISTLSTTEGNLEALQSYDSEAVTAGAMQKTVNPSGTGELPTQIAKFKAENPSQYKQLFEDKGWSVEGTGDKAKLYYSPSGKGDDKITGASLKTYLRSDFKTSYAAAQAADKARVKDALAHHKAATPAKSFTVESKALGSLVQAIRTPEYQNLQIRDFKSRLDSAIGKTPTGYDHPISDYVSSDLGRATVLDHSVNRPGNVADNFSASLDRFYAKHPKASDDPAQWGKDSATYENEIIRDYGVTRQGTDMINRFHKLQIQSRLLHAP